MHLAWQVAFCHCLRAASAIFMLVSVCPPRQQINCVYIAVCVCVHVCKFVCMCVLGNFFIIISVLVTASAAATCHLMPTLHVPLLHVVFAFRCGLLWPPLLLLLLLRRTLHATGQPQCRRPNHTLKSEGMAIIFKHFCVA